MAARQVNPKDRPRPLIVLDLERHPLAYHFLPITRRLFGWSSLTVHDGPVSVAAGFRPEELAHLAYVAAANVTQMNANTFEASSAASLCVTPCEPLVKRRATPEVELVPRLKAGDEVAFCELVERYASKIHSVTYGILRNREDADEIAQEVFAKVYFSIKSFGARSSLYTWIYRIAVNECYGYLRKKRLKLVYESDSVDDTHSMRMQRIVDGYATPDRAAMQRNLINRLLERIPEDDRLMLIWKEVEGFSITELSQMTGLNEATIKVRLFRARQKLIHAAAAFRRPCWPHRRQRDAPGLPG